MKISKLLNLGILGILTLLYSCAAIYISEISKSPDSQLNLDKTKIAIVAGNDNVSLNEFIKTFNKKYNEHQDFVNEYTNLYTTELRNAHLFNQIKLDKFPKWDLNNILSNEQPKIVDSLFTNSNADYLIYISNFDISNRYQTIVTGGGPNMGMSSSSTEFCVVKSRFQIYDIKTRRKMLEFTSKGEACVFFFAFETALIDAINKSIEHSVIYLKTGKIKFDKQIM